MTSVVVNDGPRMPQADFLKTQADCLKNRFDLTPAQARLVVHLTAGHSLRSSANALGVTYETVRRHIKEVFQKTGTHRQAELVLTVFRVMSDDPTSLAANTAHLASSIASGDK